MVMGKTLSAIEKRRLAGEDEVRKYYGKNYSEIEHSPKRIYHSVKAMISRSVKEAGMEISKDDLECFTKSILDRADGVAQKAREDYVHGLTRRTNQPIYGIGAYLSWKQAQIANKKG